MYFTNGYSTIIYTASEKAILTTNTVVGLVENEAVATVQVQFFNNPGLEDARLGNKNNYIIHITNTKELRHVIKILKNLSSWNVHAKFLIVVSRVSNSPVTMELFKTMWQVDAVKSAVLTPDTQNTSLYKLYSWRPYKKPSEIRRSSPSAYCSSGVFYNNTNWYSDPIEKCARNCTYRIAYVQWEPLVIDAKVGFESTNYFMNQGFDINIVNIIASHLNLTVHYTESGTWGSVYENGTSTGNLQYLLNNSADILAGGYFLTSERQVYFDVTDPYMQIYTIWCVPNQRIVVGFKNFISVFTAEVWMVSFIIYVTISGLIFLSRTKRNKQCTTYASVIGGILVNNSAVVLGIGIHLPKSKTTRYFMIVLIVFGLLVTLFYSDYLTSILSASRYRQKYNSIEDIYNYKLDTYFMPRTEKMVLETVKTITSKIPESLIKERWKSCSNGSKCFEDVAFSKTISFYTDNLQRDYMLSKRNYSVYCLDTSRISSETQLVFIMRKGFPFYEQFNTIMHRIVEAGLLVAWQKNIFKAVTDDSIVSEDARIGYEELKAMFKFLLIGNAVSFGVFITEIIVSLVNKRMRKESR
ncbi:hypothetical protein NQ315_015017 [Exocentrus adspersus]|uniref:Ionotropic glutamate receptor L-glutamate and glycine-binding domain-containing protein n=1 Tax=Exocentrus adspersus TaxID=1586481 RepID=A0AAV8VXU7_9CUCU|nr:hypothetical protein NQ315_015017 [Exocentrus adspersus]